VLRSHSKRPYGERSLTQRRKSPWGREGFVLYVSEIQITEIMPSEFVVNVRVKVVQLG